MLKAYSNIIKMLYWDLCDIYKYSRQIDEMGAESRIRDTEATLRAIPCLICAENADDADPKRRANIPTDQAISIHFPPEIVIKAGDYAVARKRAGDKVLRVYKGIFGEPIVYHGHTKATMKVESTEV